MKPRDRKVAIVGVVCILLSISLGTAFAIGPLQPPGSLLPDYIADWYTGSDTRNEEGLNDQTTSFNVREHNLTQVTVRLSWTDDERVTLLGRRDDTLTMRVEGPSSLEVPGQEVSGTNGELVIVFDLETVPTDDDMANFGSYDHTNATGDWSVTVSVSPAGLRDTGNDWTVTFQYSYYVGRLIDNPGVV